MNFILAISSLFFGIIHLYYAYSWNYWSHYMNFITLGIISSILNHSITNEPIKWTNRYIMINGFLFDSLILYKNNLYDRYFIMVVNIISLLFYIGAKKSNKILPHILSHLFITLSHCCIISSVYLGCKFNSSISQINNEYRWFICNY